MRPKFGPRRLWVRVNVQAPADRKGPRVINARPSSPLFAAEPAYTADGGSPGFERHMESPCSARQPLAGNSAGSKEERAAGQGRAMVSFGWLRRCLLDMLKFARLFFAKRYQAIVDLIQILKKYGNINILVDVIGFHRPKPAMKEGVFGPCYQFGNNPFQPKSKSFIAFIVTYESKYHHFSDFVDSSLSEVFINKAVSDAANRLRIDADDLLANEPIAHFNSPARAGLYFGERFFLHLAQIIGRARM
jgi:hypothetical protein